MHDNLSGSSHPPRTVPVIMFLAKAYQTDPRPRQEATSLGEAGYSVQILSWDREHEFKSVDKMDGATVLSTRLMNLKRSSSLGMIVGALVFQVLLVLRSIKVIHQLKRRPIVHAHDFNTLLPGCFLKLLGLCVGLVYDSHELSYAAYSEFASPIIGRLVGELEERCLRYVDTVITVSEPIASYLRKFNPAVELIYNCPRESEIPRTTKLEARRELGLPSEAYIVSYVGSIRYDCGLDLLLEVASLLFEQRNIQFAVVGSGPLASRFHDAAKRTPARVIIVPQVPHERALRYVVASDLSWGIYRSWSLNMRITIPWRFFESLDCKVPLIVDKGTYRAALVREYKSGIVVETNDPHELSQLILSLAAETGNTNSTFDGKSVPPEFLWEGIAPRLIQIYDSMTSSSLRETACIYQR